LSPCTPILNADGSVMGVFCGRVRKTPTCSLCKRAPGTQLCDGKRLDKPGTCDVPMCRECALHVGPNRDLCPACAKRTR
jgi:hypothetical protein